MTKGDYELFMQRVKNDRHSQDQYEPISEDAGYLCECVCDPAHLATEIAATWRRPPMPEKGAKGPAYMCEECLRTLPPTQE